MANISNLEKQWCEENSITIDDYKSNYSRNQKEQIKSEMKLKDEAEKENARMLKEKLALEAKQLKEKLALEAKQQKIQEKIDKRNAKIESYGDWADGFKFDDNGKIVNSTTNIIYLFENHPDFKGKLFYDSYTNKFIYRINGKEIYFNDKFYREIQNFKEQYIDGYKPTQTIDALKTVAEKHTYNSAINILDQLNWDGKPRIETLFIEQLKVDDTPLNREITKKWIVGAIQRLYEPGCQNENMLILTGAQGAGKSTILKWLAGSFGFDESISINSSESEYGMKLQNCWICCFDEYAGLSKREASEYKNWLSKQIDSFRAPYGRTVEDYARHNCYCATTNERTFLKDHTGGQERRMWVLECKASIKEGYDAYETRTKALWNQIMAEAVHIYKNTPDFIPYLEKDMIKQLNEQQKKYKDYNSDNVGEMLAEILDRPYLLKSNGNIDSVDDILKQVKNGYQYRASNVGEVVGHINHISHHAIRRIIKDCLGQPWKTHDYMKNALADLGWCAVIKKKVKINGKVGNYYIRGKWINMDTEDYTKEYKQYNPHNEVVNEMTSNELGVLFESNV